MKKKGILALSITLGVILAVVLVFTMAFTLSVINIERTSLIKDINRSHLYYGGATVESVQNKILEDAEFTKGGNLLVMNFDRNIENIETKNPFVKVEKIVRRFPNKITVYYTEREPVALVSTTISGAYYVIDNELKVLAYVDNLETYKLPVIDNGKQYNSNLGKFIDDSTLQRQITSIVDGAYNAYGEKDALMEDVLADATKIRFYTDYEDDARDGTRIEVTFNKKEGDHVVVATILSSKTKLKEKSAYLWKVFYTNLSQYDYSNDSTVVVYETIVDGTKKIVVADTTAADSHEYPIND